jgi:hypothetical protein
MNIPGKEETTNEETGEETSSETTPPEDTTHPDFSTIKKGGMPCHWSFEKNSEDTYRFHNIITGEIVVDVMENANKYFRGE